MTLTPAEKHEIFSRQNKVKWFKAKLEKV